MFADKNNKNRKRKYDIRRTCETNLIAEIRVTKALQVQKRKEKCYEHSG